nr:hypothetical protein [Vibrio lentus]
MLQCHFLGFVLSNTLLSMRAFVPLILSFISNYALYVEQGFNALQNIPNTYWIVVGSAVVDTLGMHAMVRYLLEYYASRWKRSDGVPRCVNNRTYYRWSLKPWHDYGFEKGHQLDKASATRPRATDAL